MTAVAGPLRAWQLLGSFHKAPGLCLAAEHGAEQLAADLAALCQALQVILRVSAQRGKRVSGCRGGAAWGQCCENVLA